MNTESINIKWNDGDSVYNGFCVIGEDNNQISRFSSCKDYTQDFYAYFFNEKISKAKYAFEYLGLTSKQPSKTNIKVAYRRIGFCVSKALDYMHKVEEALGFSTLSKIKKSNRVNTFVATGCEEWLLSPPMISFYTFLLRTSHLHVIGQDFRETFKVISLQDSSSLQDANDMRTAKGLLQIIEKIIEVGVKKIFSGPKIKNYPTEMNTHNIGISGFAYRLNGTCEHWYEGWYDND